MSTEWIKWHGGDCPVPPGTLVEVALDDDSFLKFIEAERLRWEHRGDCDITKYRLVSYAEDTPPKKEQPDAMKLYCDNFLSLSKALVASGGNGPMILQKNHEFLETLARNNVKIDAEYLGLGEDA